eukprot:TRINITY_DN125_c0_g1_i7.p2 TRINITY_DN125_c0_g1~~TRINITY_DN125_c0_g1_i7.p2  ORF type:complete len:55 (+),score=6.40 TRINITY_DN125_c0_g1_i7:126-290(+)
MGCVNRCGETDAGSVELDLQLELCVSPLMRRFKCVNRYVESERRRSKSKPHRVK